MSGPVAPAGWHPDPAGGPRLRWWDGQGWTEHVHEQAPVTAAPAGGSPLAASVLAVGPPRVAAPGTRVFELTDGDGARLGRMVETARAGNDSAFGAALSRARGWQHATTRELRGPGGYPEVIITWGPAAAGLILVTLPDRREVGRMARSQPDGGGTGWALVAPDGRRLGTATGDGANAAGGERLSRVAPDGGGWRLTIEGGPHPEPLRSLVVAAAAVADIL